MANSIHTHEMQTRQTKDFDFVFVEEAALTNFCKAYKGVAPMATTTLSDFERTALHRFHEEFKSLVLAANQAELEHEAIGWEDISLRNPLELHEIEWMDWVVQGSSVGTPPSVKM